VEATCPGREASRQRGEHHYGFGCGRGRAEEGAPQREAAARAFLGVECVGGRSVPQPGPIASCIIFLGSLCMMLCLVLLLSILITGSVTILNLMILLIWFPDS